MLQGAEMHLIQSIGPISRQQGAEMYLIQSIGPISRQQGAEMHLIQPIGPISRQQGAETVRPLKYGELVGQSSILIELLIISQDCFHFHLLMKIVP
jgi:hypothetical protein